MTAIRGFGEGAFRTEGLGGRDEFDAEAERLARPGYGRDYAYSDWAEWRSLYRSDVSVEPVRHDSERD